MQTVPSLSLGQLLYQLLTFVGPLVYAVKSLDPSIDWRPMSRHDYRAVVASLIYVVILQEIRFCVDGSVPLVIVCDILKILVVYDPKLGVAATSWLAKNVPWPNLRHFERQVVDPMLRRVVQSPPDSRMTVLHYQLTSRHHRHAVPLATTTAATTTTTVGDTNLRVPSRDRNRGRSPSRFVSPASSPIRVADDGETIAPTPQEVLGQSYASYMSAGRVSSSPHHAQFTPEYANRVFNDVFGDDRGGHRLRSKIRDLKERI